MDRLGLMKALESGGLGGLDVLNVEHLVQDSPLRCCRNDVLSTHNSDSPT